MFTRRSSDEDWVKYLLNTGLTTVDQYQGMRGGRNLVDITELISQNAARFNNVLWVNRALQQDRFHYIPKREIILGEICLLYTSPSPRDRKKYRMPSSA